MWGWTYGWGGLKGESPVATAAGERRIREMSEMTGLDKPAGLDERKEKKSIVRFTQLVSDTTAWSVSTLPRLVWEWSVCKPDPPRLAVRSRLTPLLYQRLIWESEEEVSPGSRGDEETRRRGGRRLCGWCCCPRGVQRCRLSVRSSPESSRDDYLDGDKRT